MVKGEEATTVNIFLTDTQEHDDMSVHVVTNTPEIEEFLDGYNHFLLPGSSVVSESCGLHMVRLMFRAEPGKRYFVVPSLTADYSAQQKMKKKVGHVDAKIHGTFRVSAACPSGGKLSFVQCGFIKEEFSQDAEFDGVWSPEEKNQGGPKGPSEPNRFWYRNPQFRLYVGDHHDVTDLNKMETQTEREIEEEEERKKAEAARKHAESASLTMEGSPTSKRGSGFGASTASIRKKRDAMNARKPRPYEEGTVFCCILRASTPAHKHEALSEVSVVRNHPANSAFKNPYARVIPNAINHAITTYADGSLEICATFVAKLDKDDPRPYFILPALSAAKQGGRFTLQVLATGKFTIERVPQLPRND